MFGFFSNAQADITGGYDVYTDPEGKEKLVTEIIMPKSYKIPLQNPFPDSVCVGEIVTFVRSVSIGIRILPITYYGYSAMKQGYTFLKDVDKSSDDSFSDDYFDESIFDYMKDG